MDKQVLREQFQQNKKAFFVFLLILFGNGYIDCNPDFLTLDENEARLKKIFNEPDIRWPDEDDIDNAAEQALVIVPTESDEIVKIRSRYAALMESVAGNYTKQEQETWFKQQAAYDKYKEDGKILGYAQKMADSRGITIKELMIKIGENIALYDDKIFGLLGRQQAEIDALKNT